MKDFIKRIKDDYEYDWKYDEEPVYFKAFLWFALLWYEVGKFLFGVLCFVTVPIWILPYFIWWNKKKRSNNNEAD